MVARIRLVYPRCTRIDRHAEGVKGDGDLARSVLLSSQLGRLGSVVSSPIAGSLTENGYGAF